MASGAPAKYAVVIAKRHFLLLSKAGFLVLGKKLQEPLKQVPSKVNFTSQPDRKKP
jgi:hypothetical protein